MTHLALILTAVLLFLFDDVAGGRDVLCLSNSALAAGVLLPKLALLTWAVWRGRVAARRLGGPGTAKALRWFNRNATWLPLFAAALFAADLWLGLLPRVRAAVGNPVMLDELLVWAPTLVLLLVGHAARYRVERRLRENEIIRRADRGLPIHPVPSCAEWVAGRARQDLGLLLLPLLMLMAWGEAVVQLTDAGVLGPTLGLWLGPAGALGVLVIAPLVVRHALDTVPVPPGPLRDHLLAQCAHHGVRVREVLLWRTHGTALNAAVTGLVPRLRFVLLTDALVEELPPAHLHAVMAHELNHVRHRHLPTLLVVAAALLVAAAAGGEAAAQTLAPLLPGGRSVWLDGALAVLALGLWVAAFGWASRRIERQADTPKVPAYQPAAADPSTAPGEPPAVFTADDVFPMLGALGQVASRSHLDPHRFSWRHGSIAWRQAYLRGLVGMPVAAATIHAVVRRIRLAAVLLLVLGGLGLWWIEG